MPTLTLGQLSTFTHPILPNVIEEALVEYLQSPASYVPVVSDKSPIDHHFSHVEQFMSRYVPSNSAMLKSIRLSFAKLAATPTIFDASCQLLNHITMAIGDLIFNLICTDVDIILPRLIWNS